MVEGLPEGYEGDNALLNTFPHCFLPIPNKIFSIMVLGSLLSGIGE